MEIDEKHLFKHKLDYLKLVLKISRIRYHGKEPSTELLKKAHDRKPLKTIRIMTMPNIYFTITIFVGVTLYVLVTLLRKQKQEKQKYEQILDRSAEPQFRAKTNL